jgi:hypothetical protein
MIDFEQAWKVLKDYQGYIPGVAGDSGVGSAQTIVDQPPLARQRFRDRFFDEGTKQRIRSYKAQQRAAKEAWDKHLEGQRTRQFTGVEPAAPALTIVPGVAEIDARQLLEQRRPELFIARKKDTTAADQKRKNVTRPEHLSGDFEEVRRPLDPRYWNWRGLKEKFTTGPPPLTGKPTASGRATFIQNKLNNNGQITPSEWNELKNYYATMSPGMIEDVARTKLGLRHPSEMKRTKASSSVDDDDDDEGAAAAADDGDGGGDGGGDAAASTLEERKRTHASGAHESAIVEGQDSKEVKDQDFSGISNLKRVNLYHDKLGKHWKGRAFDVEPPESGTISHRDWLTDHMFRGEDAKYAEKHMGPSLDKMSQKEVVAWLRSHPGFDTENIPDDFEFIPDSPEKTKREKRAKKKDDTAQAAGSSNTAEVGDLHEVRASLHQIQPLESAWALLKIGE